MADDKKPDVSGDANVISFNQSGGVTAGTYINQAPETKLEDRGGSQKKNNDGTYTTTAEFEVVSPYPVSNLKIVAKAPGILRLEAIQAGAKRDAA